MNKYSVQVTFSGGYVLEIEAETREKAAEIAGEYHIDTSKVTYWDADLEISEES